MELYPIDIAIHLLNIIVLYVLLRLLVWKPVRKFMAGRRNGSNPSWMRRQRPRRCPGFPDGIYTEARSRPDHL